MIGLLPRPSQHPGFVARRPIPGLSQGRTARRDTVEEDLVARLQESMRTSKQPQEFCLERSRCQLLIITGDHGLDPLPNFSFFGSIIDGLSAAIVEPDTAGNPSNSDVPKPQEITIFSVAISEQ